MKASAVAKCPSKKGGDNTGETSIHEVSPLSYLQVAGEVHFHVNTNGGIANYSARPTQKSVEDSQRTYLKKHLPSRLVTSVKEEMPYAIHLPVKAKSQSSASSQSWSVIKVESSSPRKRKAKEEDVIASKVQKASAQSKDVSQNCTTRTSPRSRPSPNCDVDSDVEVEIVDEVMPSPTRSQRRLNTASPAKKKSKYFFDHKVDQSEIAMNEADIAPAMSSDTFSDSQPGASKSMQCLSADGTEPDPKLEKRATSTQTQSSDHRLPDLKQSPQQSSQTLDEKPSTSKATHQNIPIVNKSPFKKEPENNLKGKQVPSKQSGVQQFYNSYNSDFELKSLIGGIVEKRYSTKGTCQNIQEPQLSDLFRKNEVDSQSKNMKEKVALMHNTDIYRYYMNKWQSQKSSLLNQADKSPSKRESGSSSENVKGKLVSSSNHPPVSRELKNLVIDMCQEFDTKRSTPSTSKSTGPSIASQGKRPKKSRELASLYKNLGEIAWAQESSFKKLLRDPNYIRHSDRSSLKQDTPKGKNKSKLKGLSRLLPKANKKAKALFESKAKRDQASSIKDKPKQASTPKASGSAHVKPITIKQEIPDDEVEVFYMLNPGSSGVDKEGKQQNRETAAKGKTAKPVSLPKVKAEASKAKFSSLKSTDRSPSPEPLRGKKRLKCISLVSIKTASTSGLQKNGRSRSLSSLPRGAETDQTCNGNHSSPARGRHAEGEELILACQNASKLQVRVQPLEHTDFWNNDYYDGARKNLLEQAVKRILESRELDSSHAMLQDMLVSPGNGRRRRPEEESLRSSARQSECAFRYKEIVVKRQSNYMQLVLVPNTAKQNSLTVEAMKELKEALMLAKRDPNCRAVLINSSGPYFCTGIDLAPLVGNNKKQAAEEIALSIKELVMTLGVFPKPVVAAVNGAALGFGVSLLTYCDVVLASDKATFCLPATKIGYIPEGGVTYTLPQVVGSSVASEMLMQGRRITAEQACKYGLVTEVIWPTRLMNEVIPRLQNIISQPLQGLEATKTMMRCRLWDKLKVHVERERQLLCEHWATTVCQNNIKTLLQTGWLLE